MKKTSIAECPEVKAEHGAFAYRRKRLGDYVSFPVGPPGHQIINRAAEILRYLALSTMIDPEVSVYPDSNKIGAYGKSVPGARAIYRTAAGVDYYEGEE